MFDSILTHHCCRTLCYFALQTDFDFMRKIFFPFLLLCATQLFSQSNYKPNKRFLEAGFLFGLTNYSGDLAEKNIHILESRLGYGAYARYFLSTHFALRTHLFSGSISGDDANAKDPGLRRRSFRFGTHILEVGLGGEWHILGRGRFSNTGLHHYFLSPYLYLGVGGTFSGAKAEYYGTPEDRNVYFVVPLPEVGLHQQFLIAPMGVGVRADLNEGLVIGVEVGWRPVFSDDLDGVRLNGNPDDNDWYYFGGVTLSFILNKPKRRG